MLFRSEVAVGIGDCIFAALDWPLPAENRESLYLVVRGYVVRTNSESTAISISRMELLRANELQIRFEPLAKPSGKPEHKRRSLLTPTVLVDEDEHAYSLLAGIGSQYGWVVERADPSSARRILDAGFPPICLLLTRNVEILAGLDCDVPVILACEPSERDCLPDYLRQLQKFAIVQRPLIHRELLSVISQLSEGDLPR